MQKCKNLAGYQKRKKLTMMEIPSIFIPEDWSFTFYEGINRHPDSFFRDKTVSELGCGNGWISIALAEKWGPRKVVWKLPLFCFLPKVSSFSNVACIFWVIFTFLMIHAVPVSLACCRKNLRIIFQSIESSDNWPKCLVMFNLIQLDLNRLLTCKFEP